MWEHHTEDEGTADAAETTFNPRPLHHQNVVHRALVDRAQLQSTLRLTIAARANEWVEAAAMEETQERRVQHFPDEDCLSHVLLEVVQIVLAKARKVGVSISMDRLVARLYHAAQMIRILHANHIHSVDHRDLDRGEIVESALRLQLTQGERRRNDDIAVVEVREELEVSSRQTDSDAEAIYVAERRSRLPSLFPGKNSFHLGCFSSVSGSSPNSSSNLLFPRICMRSGRSDRS